MAKKAAENSSNRKRLQSRFEKVNSPTCPFTITNIKDKLTDLCGN